MKMLATLLLITSALFSSGQQKRGYANIGPTLFNNSNLGTYIGATVSGQMPFGPVASIGPTFDLLVFQKDKLKMVPVYLDLRIYFVKAKQSSPFISIAPGYSLVNNTSSGIKTTGSFCFNAMLGGYLKPKKIGCTMAVGYSNIGLQTEVFNRKTIDNFGGVRAFFAFAF